MNDADNDLSNKTIVFVLGMHRSGTSVLSNTLNDLGVSFGEDHIPHNENVNTKGFWEDVHVVNYNEDLLSRMNARWFSINGQLTYGEYSPDSEEVIEAANVLRDIFSRSSKDLVGIKDPRLCVLLPIWKLAAQKLLLNIKVVWIWRSPHEVAASLANRDNLDTLTSTFLWCKYNLSALSSLDGIEYVVVSYEDLILNQSIVVERVLTELNLGLNILHVSDTLSAVIDSGLRHSTIGFDTEGLYELDFVKRIMSGFKPDVMTLTHEEINNLCDEYMMILKTTSYGKLAMSREKSWLRHHSDYCNAVIVVETRDAQLSSINETLVQLSSDHQKVTADLEERNQLLKWSFLSVTIILKKAIKKFARILKK